jgi:transposase
VNYVGIDLHSNNNYVVVANQEGRRLLEKRLPNDVGVIVSCLRRYDPIDSVALESTYNYYWLADGLLDADYQVKLADLGRQKKRPVPFSNALLEGHLGPTEVDASEAGTV